MAAYARQGRQASARSRSRCGDLSPVALSKTRSPAGKASGQRSARMAMYCAVQSPMPGNACKARGRLHGVGAGSQIKLAAFHGLGDQADARGAAAAIPSDAISASGASAIRAGVAGSADPGPANGVSIGSPNRAASRPASVVAARTETRWPRIARTVSSNPSNAPGTRKPAHRASDASRVGVRREVRGDHVGPGAQVEQALEPRHDLRQCRYQRRGDLDGQRIAARDRLDLQPAAVLSHRRGSQISLIDDLLDSGRRPAAQESQQRTPVERRPIRQRQAHPVAGRVGLASRRSLVGVSR